MKRRQFGKLTLSTCAMLYLVACQPSAGTAPPPSISDQQRYEQSATASGFSTGTIMAANTAYVFFDAACQHCAVLWENAKPLASRLRVIWIPVAFLSQGSLTDGAAMLAAANPPQVMDRHAQQILNGKSDPANGSSGPAAEKKMTENTRILKAMGAQSIPLIVYRHAQSGAYGIHAGSLDTQQLAALLGL